jgi:hypothetical protein
VQALVVEDEVADKVRRWAIYAFHHLVYAWTIKRHVLEYVYTLNIKFSMSIVLRATVETPFVRACQW